MQILLSEHKESTLQSARPATTLIAVNNDPLLVCSTPGPGDAPSSCVCMSRPPGLCELWPGYTVGNVKLDDPITSGLIALLYLRTT
jgi:hypothetical protein